eukprot:scaffold409_cov140-Pinguiococcus_pyrenoidosus.AAC.1
MNHTSFGFSGASVSLFRAILAGDALYPEPFFSSHPPLEAFSDLLRKWSGSVSRTLGKTTSSPCFSNAFLLSSSETHMNSPAGLHASTRPVPSTAP